MSSALLCPSHQEFRQTNIPGPEVAFFHVGTNDQDTQILNGGNLGAMHLASFLQDGIPRPDQPPFTLPHIFASPDQLPDPPP